MASPYIVDVSERDFGVQVLERSHTVPVVVDFWAPWCGPCRMLGPVLEQLAEEYGGRFVLAKVNTDENPALAARYGIQGIPAVKAFRDGKVVGEFVGAQPKALVKQFIENILPSPADDDFADGRRLESQGLLEQAERAYRRAIERDPDHWAATVALGRLLLEQERFDEAEELLRRVPQSAPEGLEALKWLSQIEFRRAAAECEDEEVCRRRLADNPDDLETRYRLASRLTLQERYDEALEEFLQIVQRNREYRDGAARKAMLSIFNILGDDHPLTQAYRAKLAMFLYA